MDPYSLTVTVLVPENAVSPIVVFDGNTEFAVSAVAVDNASHGLVH